MGKSSDFPQNLSLTVEKKDGDCLVAAMHFSTLTGDQKFACRRKSISLSGSTIPYNALGAKF